MAMEKEEKQAKKASSVQQSPLIAPPPEKIEQLLAEVVQPNTFSIILLKNQPARKEIFGWTVSRRADTLIHEIYAKTLLSSGKVDPVFGNKYNMNIYRGCEHQCIYCDSRSQCYGIENFRDVLVKINAI